MSLSSSSSSAASHRSGSLLLLLLLSISTLVPSLPLDKPTATGAMPKWEIREKHFGRLRKLLYRCPTLSKAGHPEGLIETRPYLEESRSSKSNRETDFVSDSVSSQLATEDDPVWLKLLGCSYNGTLYGEGSAMVSSSQCEYCYCIRGRQHCVRPQCSLELPGCTPHFGPLSCCPLKYICSDVKNSTVSSTTPPSINKTKDGGGGGGGREGCLVNGTHYPEGERLATRDGTGTGDGRGECEHCYCVKHEVVCKPVSCPPPLADLSCRPVLTRGHCCPTSYHCTSTSSEVDSTTAYTLQVEEVTNSSDSSFTTGSLDVVTSTLRSDLEGSTIIPDTTDSSLGISHDEEQNETEFRSVVTELSGDDIAMTTPTTTMTTDVAAMTTGGGGGGDNTSSSAPPPTTSSPAPDEVLEAILSNRTLTKEQDYDYDYNDSSLPPSLPNLKIIPFVAADAVVHENGYSSQLEGKTEIPLYLDAPKPNIFSPPSKTEGGFVPRDPVLDGPFYESKHEKVPSAQEVAPSRSSSGASSVGDLTSDSLLPPITELPKLFEEGKCEKAGVVYSHGEVVSPGDACELCVCYFKEIHCQKPVCNPPRAGCRRASGPPAQPGLCCPTQICDELLPVDSPPPGAGSGGSSTTHPPPESMSNLPAITVADLIATPFPFRDVIRTEPPPDLDAILKDMLPHLVQPVQSSQKLQPSELPPQPSIMNSTTDYANDTIQRNNYTDNIKDTKNSSITEDYDDTFSLSSVFDMLFSGEKQHTQNIKTTTKLPESTYQSIYNIKSQKHDINNAIENTENDYYNQKNNKVSEKIKDLSVYLDYPNDESRNYTTEGSVSSQSVASKSTDSTEKTLLDLGGRGGNGTSEDSVLGGAGAGSAGGLLKLAGCNIYGRMYRVGRIIAELSGPCLQCLCTQFGVQCHKLC